ncbi:hypothetical protein Dimus_026457, partial [Dionaea muscipula]
SRRTRFCRCSTLLLFNNCARIEFCFVAAAIHLHSILQCKSVTRHVTGDEGIVKLGQILKKKMSNENQK